MLPLFKCKNHGEIPAADTWVSTQKSGVRRECRICRREKQRRYYNERKENKPIPKPIKVKQYVCKVHGPLSDDLVHYWVANSRQRRKCRECLLIQQRKTYHKNKEKRREYVREHNNAQRRQAAIYLKDSYIREALSAKYNFKAADIPYVLIEAYRLYIQFYRQIREKME